MSANARLLAAAYTLLDRAGRELGVDAATLAEGLDLGALIHAARDLLADAEAMDRRLLIGQPVPCCEKGSIARMRAALAAVPLPV